MRSRVLLARDNLEAAAQDFRQLCDEIGISPPAERSLSEALNATRVAALQLEQLLAGLKRAAAAKESA